MLVDFTITNFCSIKETQTFSLYAESNLNHLQQNIAYPINDKLGLLRTVGIYGANASGKSNILYAFKALNYLITKSDQLKDGESIPHYEPYQLSQQTIEAPSIFEIEFILDNKRFIYQISFVQHKILTESLDFYPSTHKANLFNRKADHNWQDVDFGSYYKGGRKKFAFFDNNSYLSKAGNSADAPEIARSVYNYFRKNIFSLDSAQQLRFTGKSKDPHMIKKLSKILAKVDTGISDITFKQHDDLSKHQKPFFTHISEEGKSKLFDAALESDGTLKLFNLLPLFIQVLENGFILIVDELENSFHPHIAELIISLFQNDKINKHHAQLIFSTHNTSLMSAELLRPDQIWFVEKNNGATEFYSLDEYDDQQVKNDSPYALWYHQGRFDAIPKIDVSAITTILENLSDDDA